MVKNINEFYEKFYGHIPRKENPLPVNATSNIKECLIRCKCGAEYIIGLEDKNDEYLKKIGHKCGNCGIDISECKSISRHSGGIFNCTEYRN